MKKQFGFSSIELIIALALLIVLVSMAISAYNGYLRKNRDIERATIAKQIETTVKIFMKAHSGKIPTGDELITELSTTST